MVDFLLGANKRLFGGSLSRHRSALAFFTDLGVSDRMQMQLVKTFCTATPVASLDSRCQYLAYKLGWRQTVLQSKVNSAPGILTLKSETIDANLQSLESLGFRSEDVIKMAAKRPMLLNANWTTKLRKEKWAFISTVMSVEHSTLVECPYILQASLGKKLVPRWDFLCRLQANNVLKHHNPVEWVPRIAGTSDMVFSALCLKASDCTGSERLPVAHDEEFKIASWARYLTSVLVCFPTPFTNIVWCVCSSLHCWMDLATGQQ